MGATYYYAVWEECGCLVSCFHQHQTIAEAETCVTGAGSYIAAIEDGVERSLTAGEEAEVRRIHATARTGKPPLDAIQEAQKQYKNEPTRYAVMVRITVGNHRRWATWMTYDTHTEAAANTQAEHGVVAFGSPQWVELKQHSEPTVTNGDLREWEISELERMYRR